MLVAPQALSQAPTDVPFDVHSGALRDVDDTLTFCVDDRVPGWELHRDVAAALADALLLEPRFYFISEQLTGRAGEFTGIPGALLFVLLDDHCDAFAGMPLGERVIYPDFITPSSPYMTTRYVLASTDPTLDGLDDFVAADSPRLGLPVESPMRTSIAYVAPETRLHVFPTEAKLLEAIEAGTVPAGIFLETTLTAALAIEPASKPLTSHPLPTLPENQWPLGMLMMGDRLYVRELIDGAIDMLIADGTLARLTGEAGSAP